MEHNYSVEIGYEKEDDVTLSISEDGHTLSLNDDKGHSAVAHMRALSAFASFEKIDSTIFLIADQQSVIFADVVIDTEWFNLLSSEGCSSSQEINIFHLENNGPIVVLTMRTTEHHITSVISEDFIGLPY